MRKTSSNAVNNNSSVGVTRRAFSSFTGKPLRWCHPCNKCRSEKKQGRGTRLVQSLKGFGRQRSMNNDRNQWCLYKFRCAYSKNVCVEEGMSMCCHINRNVYAYLLQELTELSAFGVPGAQVLFRCHHCADATPICILSWAVHLPPLLWPDGLHTETTGAAVNNTAHTPPDRRTK